MPRKTRKKGSKNKVVVLAPDNIHSVLEQAKNFDKIVADARQEPMVIQDQGVTFVSDAKQEIPFEFQLRLSGDKQIYFGVGLTALAALQAIPVPQKIVTKGQLIISHGENKKVINLLVPKVKRLFYPNFQSIIIKQLVLGL